MKTVNATLETIVALVSAEFNAAEEFDAASIERDSVLVALVGAIDYALGQPASTEAVAEFGAIRTAYVDAWEAKAKCARISAEKQFQRVCNRAGIVKPQSGEALKKQAQREAAKQAAPASKGAQLPVAKPAKSGAAESATAAVMIALSATENEIIRLIRAGEFALVHAKIKSLEPAML